MLVGGVHVVTEPERAPAQRRGAIFVLPATTSGQQGPVAAWMSTAGWASAAQRVLGQSWIVTPGGLIDPEEARRRGSHPHLASSPTGSWRRWLPVTTKTAMKDVRQWRRANRFRVDPVGPWEPRDLAFVWQRHEQFSTAGIDLAQGLGVPSVLFVPATLVWEARQWGVTRPGWGRILERTAEQPALRAADLVACGGDLVADQVRRLGVPDDRILVTPTGVDLDLFAHQPDPGLLRRRLGLDGRFVVGWVGSFRRFHALEQAIDAVAALDDAALLLVGDGPERPRIEQLTRERGITAAFTGTVPHAELPEHLAAMDVALVLASAGETFHYSPLKLAEYLAAGVPVVAPRVDQLTSRLTDRVDALLVPAGDPAALVGAVRRLQRDESERHRLGAAARALAGRTWSWDHQVERVLIALGRAVP